MGSVVAGRLVVGALRIGSSPNEVRLVVTVDPAGSSDGISAAPFDRGYGALVGGRIIIGYTWNPELGTTTTPSDDGDL